MTAVYTHGPAEAVLRSHRTRTAENSAAHLLPHLAPDQRLLDVGAGPGTITVDLATRVASVTALEQTEAALQLSRDEAARVGAANIDFVAGDVHALDLPDASYDVVHAHQVLQHVADPVQALREMLRVCRPGGVVAVRDSDYSGFVWHPASDGLTRWRQLYLQAARDNGGEPEAGRHLLAWALAAGCDPAHVTAASSTWCYATPGSRTAWGHMWADRIEHSAIAAQLTTSGLAAPAELAAIADAWRSWAAADDGWISVLHGELVIRVP